MRYLHLLGVLAVAAATTCARTPVPVPAEPAPEVPSLPTELRPPVTELSGSWASGTGAEPTVPVVRLQPPCTHHPRAWVIEQSGNELKAWEFAESFDQGAVLKNRPVLKTTPATGWISGEDVVLHDGTNRYVLRFDAESGHLRGTRNGAVFWAVRQIVHRPSPCPGVP